MTLTHLLPNISLLMLISVAPVVATAQEPISINNTRSLSFGSFVAGAGGTVTLSPQGLRTVTGSVAAIPSASGHSAEFTISGNPDATYFIDLPSDSSVILTGPGSDMPLTSFTSEPSGAGGQLGAGGTQVLSVGVTLKVGSGQASGDYSGSFSVVVNYN
ncbi:DUF4402 domain-containing protein [Marinobacter alexandrii]|uniref:DUF4402 domain-containing protein n=1 Tax=Marinobacter alexandrii TaxID=2570351 RepID=UPI0020003DF0|nr:DUF4402 domain-containing protein [Marinobacter alexandrii]MCK2149277.1 DUF4402 domain-containing protein [Marinobacter alexandrii]